MGLSTLTRGIGFRDDGILAANWTNTTSANVTIGSVTSDGDILTVPVTFTSAVAGNFGGVNIIVTGSLSTTTYSKLIVRHKDSGIGANPDFKAQPNYTVGHDTFLLAKGTGLTAETFTLTSGTTITDMSIYLTANANLTGTFTFYIDFAYFFKETLTLPTVQRPIQQPRTRNIVELPILGREGGQLQDLGSMSPSYVVAGGLVSTTSGQSGWTNTYTADQWWQILNSLTIETGTLQADGNPTWQWFTWDQGSAKVLVKGLVPQQVPGRVAYHDYALSLKQFDILSETNANPVGALYGAY